MTTSTRRFSSLLLATCLAAPALAACVDDGPTAVDPPDHKPAPTAPTFAAASADVRARVIAAAAGHDAMIAQELADALPRYPEGGCPVVSSIPGGTVFDGGCDLVTGGRVEGRAMVLTGDGVKPDELVFERFSIETTDELLSFDGRVIRHDNDVRLEVELTALIDGLTAESHLDLDCSSDGRCVPADGGRVDVEGFGEAMVIGEWAEGRAAAGYLVVTAGDDLLVDFEGECSTYLIDDVSRGKYCLPAAPTLEVGNELDAAFTCRDGQTIVTATSRYKYPTVITKRIRGTLMGTAGPVELFDQLVTLVPAASTTGYAWEADLGACDGFVPARRAVDAVVDSLRVARDMLDD